MNNCPKSNRKKQTAKTSTCKSRKKCRGNKIEKIKDNSEDELVGLFLETKLDKNFDGKKKYDEKECKCIDHFDTLDSTGEKHIIAIDKSKPSMRIFAKVLRGIVRHHLATTKNINCIRWFAPAIIGAKPKAVRGKKCDSVNYGYAIIGEHPDRLSS